MYDTESILKDFSLPIMLTPDVKQLDQQTIVDLECLDTKDQLTKPMYHYIFNPKTGRNVKTTGKIGLSIIKKYLKNSK